MGCNFLILYAEKREGLVSKVTCVTSIVVLSFVCRQLQPQYDVDAHQLPWPANIAAHLRCLVATLLTPAIVASGIRSSK